MKKHELLRELGNSLSEALNKQKRKIEKKKHSSPSNAAFINSQI